MKFNRWKFERKWFVSEDIERKRLKDPYIDFSHVLHSFRLIKKSFEDIWNRSVQAGLGEAVEAEEKKCYHGLKVRGNVFS